MTMTPPVPAPTFRADDTVLDRRMTQRATLRSKHTQGLTRLMTERTDLRGVHALADFVDDSIRWSA
ncbi:MAG: hypothetical protein CMH83_10885 [Nocardioides sp.]|nr:hypothetical protein [Nocardioides sp.]